MIQRDTRSSHDPEFVRSVFISDVHLGSRHSQADQLLNFLSRYQPEYLYLVGDIIDGRSLQRRWCWLPECTQVLSRLFELADRGTVVRYAIGNHDEFLRDSISLEELTALHSMEIAEEFLHVTSDQRQFLVIHGDRFDEVEQSAEWVSKLASIFYEGLLSANKFWACWRQLAKGSQFSLSARLKRGVKGIVKYISEFEGKVTQYAKQLKCHGVICGHIHTPVKTLIDGILYCNAGDWVENCSALVELQDGRLELIYFSDLPKELPSRIEREFWKEGTQPRPYPSNAKAPLASLAACGSVFQESID